MLIRMRARLFASLALGLTVITGCADLFGPQLPEGAQPLVPLAVYERWWDMTRICAGRRGDFTDVRWHVVPGRTSVRYRGQHYDGLTLGHDIILSQDATQSGDLVRHEMLHVLLGTSGHPREYFVRRCGGIVVCGWTGCETESADARPDPAALSVLPSALTIRAHVEPAPPSLSIEQGAFRLVIVAANPTGNPLVVTLPAPGDDGPPPSFSYEYQTSGYLAWFDDRAWANEDAFFAPYEAKTRVFDFWIAGTPYHSPFRGNYTFRGAYGDVWAAPLTIRFPEQ